MHVQWVRAMPEVCYLKYFTARYAIYELNCYADPQEVVPQCFVGRQAFLQSRVVVEIKFIQLGGS